MGEEKLLNAAKQIADAIKNMSDDQAVRALRIAMIAINKERLCNFGCER